MSLLRRVAAAAAGTLVIAFLAVLAAGLFPGGHPVARADDASEPQTLTLFEDVVIDQGEVWDTVVVIGGDVVVRGTVENVLVVVGGDLNVGSTAVIGRRPGGDDTEGPAIVSVFGAVTVDPGAVVSGDVTDVAAGFSDNVRNAVIDPVVWPWRAGSAVDWVWAFVVCIVLAVVVVAIAPRQVAAVRDRVRSHFFSSLGWGVLGAFIGVPLSVVALIVTIVGILLLAPWLAVVVPLIFLFGLVSVATWIGSAIIRRWGGAREDLMLAAIVGVAVLSILRFVPVAGALIVFVAGMVGFGATFVAIWDWRRNVRRRRPRGPSQAPALPAGAGAPAVPSVVRPPTAPGAPGSGEPGGAATGQEPPAS